MLAFAEENVLVLTQRLALAPTYWPSWRMPWNMPARLGQAWLRSTRGAPPWGLELFLGLGADR